MECEQCGKKYQLRGWYLKHMEVHKSRAAAAAARAKKRKQHRTAPRASSRPQRCPVDGCRLTYRPELAAEHLRTHGLAPGRNPGDPPRPLPPPRRLPPTPDVDPLAVDHGIGADDHGVSVGDLDLDMVKMEPM